MVDISKELEPITSEELVNLGLTLDKVKNKPEDAF
jgi:hypothetical protein